jgi:hypothetical protein
LQNNKTSKRHRQTALDIVSQSQPWRNFGLCTATLRAIQGYTTHIDSTQRQNQAAKWRSHHTKPHQKKMDEAQHIPTSAQHGTKRTMQNTDATQQVTVSYKTMLPNHKTPRVLQGHSSIQAPNRLYPQHTLPTSIHGALQMDTKAKRANPTPRSQNGRSRKKSLQVRRADTVWQHLPMTQQNHNGKSPI